MRLGSHVPWTHCRQDKVLEEAGVSTRATHPLLLASSSNRFEITGQSVGGA
jgi:hypothetical protein